MAIITIFLSLQHDVIKPRNHAIMQGIIDKRREPFSVRRKDFWEATAQHTSKLLSPGFQQQLAHEPDGLIFQPDTLVSAERWWGTRFGCLLESGGVRVPSFVYVLSIFFLFRVRLCAFPGQIVSCSICMRIYFISVSVP